ncbi:hypothetical protein [Actinokineospora sp. HUAS TT18]|uniref:hypothetical protein n=1 Tax=Actinokineospora sp. HUAS TT18 TaxID=3447451 RepID=UPI003F51C545
MTLLAVERVKLLTTRSPWWCTLIALAVTVGVAALITGTDADAASVAATQFGAGFGLTVVMVMATLAVTTEYRFSTIRATFQAIPNRTAALLAKTTVVALLAGIIGELAGFGSWALSTAMSPVDLTIDTAFEWRTVAGVGLVYAIAAVISVAVGVIIRHSAGAIALLLIYTRLVEGLVSLIPNVGADVYKWLPFTLANHFLTGEADPSDGPTPQFGPPAHITISPWTALALFAAFAATILTIALITANKRDA